MSLIEFISDSTSNPLQVVEDIAAVNSWSFERSGDNEITIGDVMLLLESDECRDPSGRHGFVVRRTSAPKETVSL